MFCAITFNEKCNRRLFYQNAYLEAPRWLPTPIFIDKVVNVSLFTKHVNSVDIVNCWEQISGKWKVSTTGTHTLQVEPPTALMKKLTIHQTDVCTPFSKFCRRYDRRLSAWAVSDSRRSLESVSRTEQGHVWFEAEPTVLGEEVQWRIHWGKWLPLIIARTLHWPTGPEILPRERKTCLDILTVLREECGPEEHRITTVDSRKPWWL